MKNLIFFFFIITISNAQTNFESLEDDFEDFAELTREQIYTHTNKTTYISGESIWLKTYIFSRDIMGFSEDAANIYCVIYDKKNKPIKQKMLMGINGVANGEFLIDSTFNSGEYILKTYTNWSRNFKDEYVHHESVIKIINPDENTIDKAIVSKDEIDVQLLPESGHLLVNTNNRVGIVAKDSFGKAVENLRVTLYENQNELAVVELNHLGINVFNLLPKSGAQYQATYYYNDKKYNVDIPLIESKGVIIQTKENTTETDIVVHTNNQSLPELVNKPFKLTIHNTVDLISYDFLLQESTLQLFKFNNNELFPGINIITLFNSKGQPIAERIFFNYEGIKVKNIQDFKASKENDSTTVTLKLNDISEEKIQSLSASILPYQTKSYNNNNNIISAFLLKPYLKGSVENLNYFFENINNLKKKELNQLLLTQAWSMYNWDNIFNDAPEIIYDYDYGITYRASSNSKTEETFLIYPNYNTKSELLSIKPNSFKEKIGFFPFEGEKLRVGRIQKNKNVGKANLILNFMPSQIPDFNNKNKSSSVSKVNQLANQGYNISPLSELDKIQKLDEVKIIKKKEYTRIEKIQNKTIGKIFDFDEDMKRRYRTFAQFISSHGYLVETTKEIRGEGLGGISLFRIETRNIGSINGTKEPRIFLNDVYLADYNFLNGFSMGDVDYVEVNRSGIGEGLRASAGVIRIYTDPNKNSSIDPKISFSEYEIPLTFTQPKTFYSPKYSSIKSQFFKEYGAIDWKPNLKFNNGNLSFKIQNTGMPVNIFIEGVVNSDTLISQTLTID